MSEKYKDALNKIVVTDEMKEKIIAKASLQKTAPIAAVKEKPARRTHWVKYGLNIAAGFLICAVAVSAGRYVYSPDISNVGSAPSSSVPETDTSDQVQSGSAQAPADSTAGISESHTVSGNTSSEARQSDVNTSTNTGTNTGTNTSAKTGAIASASAESDIRQDDYIKSAGNVTERTSRTQSTDSAALGSDYTAPASPGANETGNSNAGLNKGLNTAAGGSTAASSDNSAVSDNSALASGTVSADTAVSSSASVPSGYFESASNETALEGAEAQNAGDAESAPLLSSSGADDSGLVVNPIQKADGIEQLQNQVGYVFKLPQYLPDEYTFGECSVFFGRLIEINYVGDNNSITYRTEKNGGNTEDISGDYNEYESVETESVGNTEVTLKSTDNLYYNAAWNDGSAYALSIENGIDKDTIMKIVESVDYPADTEYTDTAGGAASSSGGSDAESGDSDASADAGADTGAGALVSDSAGAASGDMSEEDSGDSKDAEDSEDVVSTDGSAAASDDTGEEDAEDTGDAEDSDGALLGR